jgi:hypothetical protein
LVQGTGRALARGIRQQIAFQPESRVPMAAMIPLVLTGAVLLYNQGIQKSAVEHGRGGDPKVWKRVLLEAGLGDWLAGTVGGAYTLLGITLGAFRAGQEDTLPGKLHAIVNTGTTLFLGWLGVNLFSGMAMAAQELDDHNILKSLNHARLKPWIDNGLRGDHPELAAALNDLRDTITQKVEGKPSDPDRRHLLARLRERKIAIIDDLEALAGTLRLPDDATLQREWRHLTGWIAYSGSMFTRFRRYVNPMCGYILMGLLLGAPLARLVNRRLDALLDQRAPGLKTRQFTQPVFPENNAVLQPALLPAFYGGKPA